MATRRKSSAKSKPGGMVSGIVIGLVIGLAAAVAVALYVTQAPMPFMDKASREIEQILLPDVQHAPDPNRGLYGSAPALEGPLFGGKEAQIAEQLGPLRAPTVPAPTTPQPTTPEPDSLGSLIAQLPNPNTAPAPTTAPPLAPPKPSAPQVAVAPTTYYLQAGAFRSAKDAEAMRARILLLGMDASVQSAPYNDGTINRVRVGPFSGVDDMNKARSVLGREKIETSVVRP
ncbi:MAG TPA: SPOR domain-containing protein [Paenalcaligenes hominis]|mgnify:FL=1|uniref:Cell division protein FtsN n=1 Tax=Paenalcaligenes hominis TaxID=643674 RepID=A0A9D3AB71_9BURK|nr:SPOR domain-containing protein [Paenalcaligenes hominis]NJB65285.1 cell division protein FtsN [Paenalcaligenes hominis]GGE72415.1 exported protein [Paenalcaligenes hominis]HJH23899.1 SPOR domain-containing protein [Paenalcaligenes hominis]